MSRFGYHSATKEIKAFAINHLELIALLARFVTNAGSESTANPHVAAAIACADSARPYDEATPKNTANAGH